MSSQQPTIDVDPSKVDAIREGRSYISDIPSDRLTPLTIDHFPPSPLTATTDYSILAHCDVAIICVPTPLNKSRDPDVRFLIAAGESVARYIHPGMLVVLESTTYPGTTEELLLPMLEEGLSDQWPAASEQKAERSRSPWVGVDFFLAYSPERIDPGRMDWTVEKTPKVVGGMTPACLEVATALYQQAVDRVVPVTSPAAAEMVKLLENTFRAVNIGLVNEVLLMSDKLGLDVWEVIDAAATKPFGFMKFTPGPGLGGHCIPIDPLYLSWKLKMLNYNARFIELASEINADMPRYWVQKVQDALNEQGKAVKSSRILVLGVAYKKDVSDIRESPALDIIHLLQEKGGLVTYHDPHVPVYRHDGLCMESVHELAPVLRQADCIVIVTDHSAYDWPSIHTQARLVVDTRRTLRHKTRALS